MKENSIIPIIRPCDLTQKEVKKKKGFISHAWKSEDDCKEAER